MRDLVSILALLLALAFLHASLWRGELPEAGPRTCGSLASVLQIARADSADELAARPEAQVHYPPLALLARARPAEQAAGRAVLAHHALALAGTYLLARTLGLAAGAALLAAIAFGFCGPVVARHADLPGLATLSWLPLLLAAIGFCRAPRPPARTAALGAPIVALMLLAGAPGTALALIAGVLVADGRGRGRGLAALLALGLAGAAAGWLPWLLAPPAVGSPGGEVEARLAALATLTVPFALGGTLSLGLAPGGPLDLPDRWLSWLGLAGGPGPWYGAGAPGASILYLGLVPFALLALLRGGEAPAACRRLAGAGATLMLFAHALPHSPWAFAPWAGGALVALALALCSAHAVEAYDTSPKEEALRRPPWRAWIALVAVALSGLAAAALPDAPRAPELVQIPGAQLAAPRPAAQLTGQCAFTLIWGTLLAAIAAGLLARHAAQPFAPGFLGLALALLAFIDQGALFAGRAWVPRRPEQLRAGSPAATTDRELLAHMRFDVSGRILVHVTGGLPARRLAWMLAPNQGLAALFREDGCHLIDGWNVVAGDVADVAALARAGVALVLSDVQLAHPELRSIALVPWMGRHAHVHRVRGAREAPAILREVPGGAAPPPGVAVVRAGSLTALPVSAAGESVERKGHTFRAKLLSPALLLVPLAAGDPWVAAVDGVDCPVIDAGGLAAVRLPAGTPAVTFRYRVAGLEAGRALSLAALFFWLATAAAGIRRAGSRPGSAG